MEPVPPRTETIKIIGLALVLAAGGRHEDAVRALLSRDHWAMDAEAAPWFDKLLSLVSAEVADVGGVDAGLHAMEEAGARGDGEAFALAGQVRAAMGDDSGAVRAFVKADEQGSALGALGHAAVLLRDGDSEVPRAEEALVRATDRGSAAAAAMLCLSCGSRGDTRGAIAARRRSRELGFDWDKLPEAQARGARGVVARGLRATARSLRRFTDQQPPGGGAGRQ